MSSLYKRRTRENLPASFLLKSTSVMKAIFMAAVLAVVSATYSSSSEENPYYVKAEVTDQKMRQTASDFENTAEKVQSFYRVKPASYPETGNNRGPPYANTYFAAYREKVISGEMQEKPYFDYLRDVPKQSAYNPIRYSTYFQQNAKQADYVIGVSYNY